MTDDSEKNGKDTPEELGAKTARILKETGRKVRHTAENLGTTLPEAVEKTRKAGRKGLDTARDFFRGFLDEFRK